MAIEKMALINLIGNLEDLDDTLLACLRSGFFHPEVAIHTTDTSHGFHVLEGENPYAPLLTQARRLSVDLDISLHEVPFSADGYTPETVKAYLDALQKQSAALAEQKRAVQENILQHDTETVLEAAFRLGHEGTDEERLSDIALLKRRPRYFTVSDFYDEADLDQAVAAVADQYDVAAVSAALVRYDEDAGFQYSEEKPGRQVDRADLKNKLKEALDAGEYSAVLTGAVSETAPALNLEQAEEAYTCLAEFSTEAGVNSEDRDHNVKLASDTINNTLLAPGEEFSMNALIGETSEAQGYREAATYAQGQVVPEFGGGVCQVSSTIYNAAVSAGLKTTERNSHSMTVSYVEMGEDAMIAYSYSDLKFVNNSSGNILVLVDAYGPAVTCYIYGIPILEEGVTVEMDSYIEEILPIPDPEYEEDDSLAPGEEKYRTRGKEGYRVLTDLVTKKDGVEISREFLHTSTYRPQTPVIRRNSG